MNVAIKFEKFSNLDSVSPSALYILAAPLTNLMHVAETFGGKSANFADLGDIHPSALYVLAADSTPDAVRIEFTELARMGQQVTHKAVKDRNTVPSVEKC